MKNFKAKTISHLWVSSHDTCSDFYVSSWHRKETPVPMMVMRVLMASMMMGIFVWSLYEAPSPFWLIYLTHWGLILNVMMVLSAVMVSFISVCKTYPERGLDVLPWYIRLYWLMFNIAVTFEILVTALYWTLVYNAEHTYDLPRLFWLDLGTHAIASCIVLAEFMLSRTPVRLWHFYQPLGVLLWYLFFNGIYYAAGGLDPSGNPYVYEVLDWRNGWEIAGIIGGATLAFLLIYIILWILALGRDKISIAMVRTVSKDLMPVPPDRHVPPGMA